MTMLDNTRLRLRLWISKVCNRFICTPYYNFRGFLARNQAKPIPEQVAQLLASRNRLLGDDPKLVIKAARDCSKYLAALRLGLIGNSKMGEIDQEALSELFQIAISCYFLEFLVDHLPWFEFEARKDAVFLFNALLRRQVGQRAPTTDYIINHPEILLHLLRGYERFEVALNCGLMLRDCLRYEDLAEYLLTRDEFNLLFDYVQLPNFDVASDAFATLREILTRHKMLVASYLINNYEAIMSKFCHLIKIDNYVCRRQSLKLLGELLLDEANQPVMLRFIETPDNLKMMMNLLRDKSKNIQLEAFHIFKLFVANPYKVRPVYEILMKNQRKLVDFLSSFRPIKEDDEMFYDEKRYIMQQIIELGPSININSNRNSTAS